MKNNTTVLYRVEKKGLRWDQIAQEIYGHTRFLEDLYHHNFHLLHHEILPAGSALRVPCVDNGGDKGG